MYLLAEVTAHVKSTADALELRKAVNLNELGVVGNLDVTTDLGKERERDVVELLVGNNSNGLTNAGQVGGREGLETVVVETKRSVEGFEGGDGDGTAETEGQVASPDEVGKLDLDGLVVIGKGQRGGDVTKLHGDGVNVAVVGNEDLVSLLNVDTLERAESSVLDIDLVGLGDLGGEADLLEVGERLPLDRVNGLELGEVQGVEGGEALEVHGSVESLEVAGANLLHVGVVMGDQVTGDLLDAIDGNVLGGAGSNGNVTREGRAASQGSGIAGILDGGGCGNAAGGWRS